MKKSNFLWFLSLALILGCSQNSLQDSTIPSLEKSNSAKSNKFVPFKASETASSVSTTDNGNIRTIIFEGSGNATHLGHYTSSYTQIVDLTIPGSFTGSAVLTAANDDQLHFNYEGSIVIDFPSLSFVGQTSFIFSGGTGRFEDAEGSGNSISTGVFLSFPPNPNDVVTLDLIHTGEISY